MIHDRDFSSPAISRVEKLTLLLLALLYAVPVIVCWNSGYLDFGDGNYMYISWRLSQGAVLYRDILAPQPPLHLYIGAGLAWLGERLLPHPLWAFRGFSLALHLATMVLVWMTARVVHSKNGSTAHPVIPLAAAAIYLLLPIGFWWTLGYQSQPLLIFLLLIMFYGVVRNTGKLTGVAAAAAGLALLTNMTTAPYVLFTGGWLLLRHFRHGLLFCLLTALPSLIVIPTMEAYTGAYISNVFENQAGAFPRPDVLAQSGQTVSGYVMGKIITEGGDVLRLEGSWVALAALGMLIYGARRRQIATEYVLFFSFFSLCSILYVAKGGTVDYVFSLAEPYVAIFAATSVVAAGSYFCRMWRESPSWKNLTPLAAPFIGLVLLLAVAWPGIHFSYLTLNQQTYELTEPETMRLVSWIRQRTKPDDLIIAPPHLAFMARRHIVEDYSEHFLWRLKYMNERLDGEEGRAVKTIQAMAAQLNQKNLPFLVLDMNQTGILPEIIQAVEANYRPLLDEPLRTLNTPLQLYEPKR